MRLWRYGREIEQLGQRYRLEGALGSGGMADVCLAWDGHDEREVAIKVIKPDALDQRSLDRFLKEAAQVANWHHPNILHIYSDLKLELLDAAQGAIIPYIVMEYAQGGDLQKRLTSGQPYPLAETLDIFAQLCSAVSYAHEHGIIHRDLKPLNILFRALPNAAEQVVLSDFGLAVEMDATHHTFARGGTLPYMAPEQLLKGHVEAASDIFALGVILYQLCTGRLPFRRSLLDLRRADAFALPPPPSSFEPSLPADLDEAILTALNEEPAARYADAGQFWHAVQESISSLQTSTRDRSLPISRSGNAQRGPQTRILRDSSPFSTEPRQTSHPTRSDPDVSSGRASRRDVTSSPTRSTLDSHPAARRFQTRILPPDASQSSPAPRISFGLAPPDLDAVVVSEPEIDTDAGYSASRARPVPSVPRLPGTRPTPRPPTSQVPRRTSSTPRHFSPRIGITISVALVVLLIAGGLVYFVPALHDRLLPGATVTVLITPARQSVPRAYTIPAPNASARQVTSSQAQSQTAQASGHRQIQATQAKGQLTFFNSAFVAQKILANTTVAGKDGVQVVTDADANIPPDNSNTGAVGRVSVPAHATNAGAKGNIAVLDLDRTCCIPNNPVFVRNLNAFTGGQDAQSYNFVKQSDVDAVANPLVKTLTTQGQAGLKARLNTGEQIAGAPQCTPDVASDPRHPVDDTGVNVAATTVNVTVQCSAEAYNQGQLQDQVTRQQQSAAPPGPNYGPGGSNVTRVMVQGTNLLVNVTTTWIYQIGPERQQRLAQGIVGLTVAAATRQLTRETGVRSVVVEGLSAASQLPRDPARISIVIQNTANS